MKFTKIHICLLLAALLAFSLVSCTQPSAPVMGDTEATETPETTETAEPTEPPETEPPLPKKRVAFTYDDGPAFDNSTAQRLTYKLVDKFSEYGGAATFFLVGNRINKTTGEAIKYASEHGCEIGIHAYTHDYNFSTCDYEIFESELADTKAAIEKYSGKTVTLFRPPYGSITEYRAEASGYPIIHWNLDSEDWRYKGRADDVTAQSNIDTIVDNVLSVIEDGDIILMHEIYLNTYEATCIILDRLAAEGYEFVTVTELLGEKNMKVGEIYYNGEPIA